MDQFIVRVAKPDQISLLYQLCNKEHWNLPQSDIRYIHQIDSSVILVGLLHQKPIGFVSVLKFNQHFGFLGYFIVIPEYRQKGYGNIIFQEALQKFGDVNIGLNGVIKQVPYYQKKGFKTTSYAQSYHYLGNGMHYASANIKPYSSEMFQEINNLDQRGYYCDRSNLLKIWLNAPGTKCLVYFENNIAVGYGVFKKSYDGYRLGPLVADNVKVALQLGKSFGGMISENQKVFIYMPVGIEWNDQFISGLNLVRDNFIVARMFTKPNQKDLVSFKHSFCLLDGGFG